MSGDLSIDGTWWSAQSSVFYWVIDTAADVAEVQAAQDDQADGAEHLAAAAVLREVSVQNLGWLDVTALEPGLRRAVLTALAGLTPTAERTLPRTPHRDGVLAQVAVLVGLAAEALGRPPQPVDPERAQPGGAQSS